jgi:hypothetical protein
MAIRLPVWLKLLAALLVTGAAVGCQAGSSSHPVPSVVQIGSDLNCATGDHGFEDVQVGWGFCYPGTWKYQEKSQSSSSPSPAELDLTFDITDIPCTSPAPGAQGGPVCSPGAGLFAFMIISTYQRNGASSLAAWEQTILPTTLPGQDVQWGNAVEAQQLADGRRIALTPHQVVIMDLHSGVGNLNLEAAMSARLSTWKFSY